MNPFQKLHVFKYFLLVHCNVVNLELRKFLQDIAECPVKSFL